jgi:hypothetical protein
MQIFLNETSFHAQFYDQGSLERAFRRFYSMLHLVETLRAEYKLFRREDPFQVFEVIRNESVIQSANHLRDHSLTQAFFDVLYNRLQAIDWKSEQVHSELDGYVCLSERVNDTSLAELGERKLRDPGLLNLLVNFPNSKFAGVLSVSILKNGADSCELNCADDESELQAWLKSTGLIRREYDPKSKSPPLDGETVLVDSGKFQKTHRLNAGRIVYREIETGWYWYVDNLHWGAEAQIEVFDSRGLHIGEASLEGLIDRSKSDASKKFDVS